MSKGPNQGTPVSEEYLRATTIGELTALAAPILLVEYDPQWPHRFQEEAQRMVLVQILRRPDSGQFCRFKLRRISDYAARAACQISGILAVRRPSFAI
jgi:hypothetical protein